MTTEEEEEEKRLSEIIRDYIELESPNPTCYFSWKSLEDPHTNYNLSLQEILENVTVSEAEIMGKILFYLGDLEPTEKLKKWIVMRLGVDLYEASLCATSWVTTSRCPSVFKFTDEYEYIEVMIKKDEENRGSTEERLIVDIDFRSQFELARPTPTYETLSNSLPSVFVGNEEKLEKIITLLCSAAKESLRERGLHIPPWRKLSYMHSKWLSKNCKKVSFSELDTIL